MHYQLNLCFFFLVKKKKNQPRIYHSLKHLIGDKQKITSHGQKIPHVTSVLFKKIKKNFMNF